MLAFGFISHDEKKCKYTRPGGELKVKCYDMHLKEVPQYLTASVEILDLSYNRIRKLKKNSFERYGSIKYLLLYDNMIQSVEPDTFAHMSSLQEIDISNNALLTIPLEIFQLPSLRNIYADSNDLINLTSDLVKLKKPIQAPLEYLNVADCGLEDLPDLGILPNLLQINASSNPLTQITMENFAQMCHIQIIDLLKTQLPNCACLQIVEYANLRKLKRSFLPICKTHARSEIENCPSLANITVGLPEYEQCNQAILNAATKTAWKTIGMCLGAGILAFIILFYCIHRRQRHKAKKKQRKRFIEPERKIRPKDELLGATTETC